MNFTLTDNSLSLRPYNDADIPLLFQIYASTREQEMQMLTMWTDEQKNAFVMQQFNAQHIYYKQHYQHADFYIVEREDNAIGRLYIDVDRSKSINIIDITLLPLNRNKGTGTSILRDILQYAGAIGKKVTIHVENFNPALHLYKRLGFQIINETNEVYYFMEHDVRDMALQPVRV